MATQSAPGPGAVLAGSADPGPDQPAPRRAGQRAPGRRARRGDGLITNVSLILGVAGASTNASAIRLVGIAGLLAGAFSMAAGELVSVRAQHELMERELQVEQEELAEEPEAERRELAAMYRARGVPPEDADTVARILSPTPAWPWTPTPAWSSASTRTRPGRPGMRRWRPFSPSESGPCCPCCPGSSAAAPVRVVALDHHRGGRRPGPRRRDRRPDRAGRRSHRPPAAGGRLGGGRR